MNSIAWILSKLRFPLAVALGGTGKDTTAGLLADLKAAGAYAKDNIVGAVSQVASVPTGAIIESGANATGSFVRYADGTQICWFSYAMGNTAYSAAIGSLFFASGPVLTFPRAFIASPIVKYGVIAAGADVWTSEGQAYPTATQTQSVLLMAPTNSSRNTIISYIAIGRWF